jgi:hypothetical protein
MTRILAGRLAAAVVFCLVLASPGAKAAVDPANANTVDDVKLTADQLASATPVLGSHDGDNPKEMPEAASSSLPQFDTVVNFSDQFIADGVDSRNRPRTVWPYTMVGQPPQANRKTVFNAPVVPVVLEMLDPNGNVAVASNGAVLRQVVTADIVNATLRSPIFEPFAFTSGTGQLTEQLMRVEFWDRIRHDGDEDGDGGGGYRNVLRAAQKRTRTMRVPFGSYAFALNADGTCCFQVRVEVNTFFDLLFPPTEGDRNFIIGQAQADGDITTRDVSTFLFNAVYLFQGTVNNCCIVGFHSADVEPGDARNGNRTKLFMMNYSSWVPHHTFAFGFEDVAALSHEMSELFNDPLGNNPTPWWYAFDPRGGFICQNNLETGDVIEVLSGLPIFAASQNGRTFHLQNEALLPWFALQTPSPARNGAYSFPDEKTLTRAAPPGVSARCANVTTPAPTF